MSQTNFFFVITDPLTLPGRSSLVILETGVLFHIYKLLKRLFDLTWQPAMESGAVSSLPGHNFNPAPRKHGGDHQLWGTLEEFLGLPQANFLLRLKLVYYQVSNWFHVISSWFLIESQTNLYHVLNWFLIWSHTKLFIASQTISYWASNGCFGMS